MTRIRRLALVGLSAALIAGGCQTVPSSQASLPAEAARLVGAWRSKIAFRSGPLVEMKNLEFLYAYNAGGTMTESSNYDEAANSSPPAYGVWRQLSSGTFQTKYVFYTTASPGPGDSAPNDRDWWPAGHGVLNETITLADDGRSYTSTITLALFDKTGAPIPGAAGVGEGTATGMRIDF